MIELNKIYNENCLDTMSRMPDNFIDLTVTSPPYDNLRDYKGYSFDFENIAKELFRVTKIGGAVVWVVGDATINGSETGTSFKQALFFKEVGFNLHDTMIYRKINYLPLNHNRYEQEFEFMFVFSKDKLKTFNPIKEKCLTFGGLKNWSREKEINESSTRKRNEITKIKEEKYKSNIWGYKVGNCGDDNTLHPAPFPEQLAADHIYSWSNEGDLIYDCFGGSGTTAKMAHIHNRNWILSEISKEYCELSEKRIDPYLRQLRLF
jgi:site-specific DNA-methyltransferase (adenine-specific)